jgi:hypothetical protein
LRRCPAHSRNTTQGEMERRPKSSRQRMRRRMNGRSRM